MIRSFSKIHRLALVVGILCLSHGVLNGSAYGADSNKKGKLHPVRTSQEAAALRYAEAVSAGDRAGVGRLDFGCLYQLVSRVGKPVKALPPPEDPYYAACWQQLADAHRMVIEQQDQNVYTVWPGKGSLVFFSAELTEYAPSFFVMDQLGLSPPGGGVRLELTESRVTPAASFRLGEKAGVVSAPATMVGMKVTYKDPLLSPVTFAPGLLTKLTSVIKSPKQALKQIKIRWVVLSGLRRLGFPVDVAVVNIPGSRPDESPVPFVSETGGYEAGSGVWWRASDSPGVLVAAVSRVSQLPEQRDRIAMLNRVLIIDPVQQDALTILSRELYHTVLSMGATAHQVSIGDPALATRFNELYWDIYSETVRTDISLGMEMGGRLGLAQPTAADYFYRMVPAMETLAKARPEDLENRLRLGIAYRWNNDQLVAIATHEALLKDIRPELPALRAKVLIELAWSRIAKVAWNRNFDDPNIVQAYKEAEEALSLTTNPMDKFTAAYTMAYSLAFTPHRDNKAMVQLLTDAHHWYMRLPGASQTSWVYLLGNDTLKGVVSMDPAFKPLLAAS
ncbi:MAG TPA: hypothetical protein VGJ57_00480 [Nitrospirales bacterium]